MYPLQLLAMVRLQFLVLQRMDLWNYSGYPVNITAVSVNDKVGGWKLVDTLANPKDLVVA